MDDSQAHNGRQLERMLETISSYEDNQITLKSLVPKLEGLVAALQDMSVEWTNSFRQKWGILDDVYADMEYTRETQLDNLRAKLVSDALSELRQLVDGQLRWPLT